MISGAACIIPSTNFFLKFYIHKCEIWNVQDFNFAFFFRLVLNVVSHIVEEA